ncbi:hypothetical protein BN1263170098 [Stenotrophomonas indicatrix]|nr:hypothetical protein BN1263170098 [Stenotrophomonas indicatrix]
MALLHGRIPVSSQPLQIVCVLGSVQWVTHFNRPPPFWTNFPCRTFFQSKRIYRHFSINWTHWLNGFALTLGYWQILGMPGKHETNSNNSC